MFTVARSTRIFNDSTDEIQRVTFHVKTDIQTLDREIDTLDAFVSNDNSAGSTQQSNRHSRTVVKNLRTQLAMATKQFQEILQIRTKNLKAQNTKRKRFGATGSRLRKRTVQSFTADDQDASSDSKQLHSQSLMIANEEEEKYYVDQATAVESIESVIHELSTMYRRLADIVQMQGELVLRIDSNMDEATANVEDGHQQLVKYFERVSGSRWLIIKVFLFLIVFVIFFIVFVV
jgi:syntaxin 5